MGTIIATASQSNAMVRLEMQFNPAVTGVAVGRQDPEGYVELIRSGATVPLSGGFAVIYDYEAPLDSLVSYRATQVTPSSSTPETAASGSVRVYSEGYTWLKDPGLPSRNIRLDEVEGIKDVVRPARAGVFHIIDRTHPVVVSARREGRQGDFTFTTATDAQSQELILLLSRGTVLLLQTPAGYGIGSIYIHVGDVTENRPGTLGAEPTRRWTLPVIMVDRPAGLATMPPGNTWADVDAAYISWQALYDTRMKWFQVAEGGI